MRKILSLILTVCIAVSVIIALPITASAEEVLYGYINDLAFNEDGFGIGAFLIQLYDSNGSESIYNSKNLVVNGVLYSDEIGNLNDLKEIIPTGVFAKYTVLNGFITTLYYDTTADVYTDITYNPSTKKFVGVDVDTTLLPVYYKYNDKFVTPTLDENHKYNIEVYDYGINITAFSAINAETVINEIEINDAVNSDFLQDINITCKTESKDLVLKAQLYNSAAQLISEQKAEYSDSYKLSFINLPNADAEYTVKLWLEDKKGTAVSQIYAKTYSTVSIPVLYGCITDYYYDENYFGIEFLSILFCNSNGEEKIYTFTDVLINGEKYVFGENIPLGVFAKFAVNNKNQVALNYSDTYKTFNNLTYDSSTKKFAGVDVDTAELPVYYKYNDKFAAPALDENHKYNIDVYNYAVNITSISPLNTSDDITDIRINNSLNSDFLHSIDVNCDATSNDSVLIGQIYDMDSKLTAEKRTEYNNGYKLSFSGLSGKYTVKLWLEDRNGNISSPTYTKTVETDSLSILSGYIINYNIEINNFDHMSVSIKFCAGDGNISIYNLDNLIVNGVEYSNINNNIADLLGGKIIPPGAFAEYAVLGEDIIALNFNTESVGVSDFEYTVSGDVLNVKLTVKNNFDAAKNANVFIASYKSGKLNDIVCVPISMRERERADIRESLSNIKKADTLKIFIWESLNNIAPYNPSIKLNIGSTD